jgi:hypothetical protein
MQSQRRLTRRHLAVYLDVVERGSGVSIGKLADLTPTGLMISSSEPLEVNATFHLSITLPEGIANRPTIDLQARSLWSKPDANPSLFTTGFELTRLSDEDRRLISRLLVDYGLHE